MRKRRYTYYLALSDFLILGLSVFFSINFLGKTDNINLAFLGSGSASGVMFFPFLLVGAVFLLVSESSQLYKPSIIIRGSEHTNAVIKGVLFTAVGLTILSLILAFSNILQASILIGSFTVTAFLLLYVYRVKIVTPYYRSKIKHENNVLLAGDFTAASILANKLSAANNDISIAGFIGTNNKAENNTSIKKLGSIEHLDRIVKEFMANEIIIVQPERNYEELFNVIKKCREKGLEIKISSPLFKIVNDRLEPRKHGENALISLQVKNNFYTRYGKRLVDIFGALIGLAILSPLFAVLSILIKSTSPGPVFFKQTRVGRDGKTFDFYKFRSMYQVPEEDKERAEVMREFLKKETIDSGDAKVVNSARVTKIGKVIRKTSIDELPQFYNVLKGEMSLVGPRPEVPYVYEMYKDWQKGRVSGVPGCTGVWQVTARSLVTFNEMVILDIYYLSNISFILDLKMIFKTIPVMILSKGGR